MFVKMVLGMHSIIFIPYKLPKFLKISRHSVYFQPQIQPPPLFLPSSICHMAAWIAPTSGFWLVVSSLLSPPQAHPTH